MKNALGVFHEPCGIRKYPGGVFSRKAVADSFGQVMNGERGCGVSRYGKNALGVFHEPCGIRKYPGGVFSRKAVADLFGQAMNGERKIRRLRAAL